MDRMPIGLIRCPKLGSTHEACVCLDPECGHPHHWEDDQRHLRCVECDLTIKAWNIYIPEKDETATLYLSEILIAEEAEPYDLA